MFRDFMAKRLRLVDCFLENAINERRLAAIIPIALEIGDKIDRLGAEQPLWHQSQVHGEET